MQGGDNYFLTDGVRLSVFTDLIADCGGPENLEGLSTAEVYEKIILPKTLTCGDVSYCEYLKLTKNNQQSYVGEFANVFIAHAWQYQFLDLVDTLIFHFQHEKDTAILWFDVFCCRQQNFSFDVRYFESDLKSGIGAIGRTVLVFLGPWKNSIPFSRTWILYEIYCTMMTNSLFEIALTLSKERFLIEDITTDFEAVKAKDSHNIHSEYFSEKKLHTTDDWKISANDTSMKRLVNSLLSSVDILSSEASNMQDRDKILSVLEKDVGIYEMNELVAELIRKWAIKKMYYCMKNEGDSFHRLRLMSALANLYIMHKEFAKGEELLLEALRERHHNLGRDHVHTQKTLADLAILYEVSYFIQY